METDTVPESAVTATKLSKAVTPSSIRRAAMDLLARREHSRFELITKLTRRFRSSKVNPMYVEAAEPIDIEPIDIEPIVLQLCEENLQSDERFAEVFVRYRMQKGQGPMRIVGDLKMRQVSEVFIDRYVYSDGIDWFEAAKTVKSKKYGDTFFEDYLDQAKFRAKQQRFLQSRGFSIDQIQYAFSNSCVL